MAPTTAAEANNTRQPDASSILGRALRAARATRGFHYVMEREFFGPREQHWHYGQGDYFRGPPVRARSSGRYRSVRTSSALPDSEGRFCYVTVGTLTARSRRAGSWFVEVEGPRLAPLGSESNPIGPLVLAWDPANARVQSARLGRHPVWIVSSTVQHAGPPSAQTWRTRYWIDKRSYAVRAAVVVHEMRGSVTGLTNLRTRDRLRISRYGQRTQIELPPAVRSRLHLEAEAGG